jgi:hypothetical protein
MKRLQLTRRVLFPALLFCLTLAAPPILAQEQDLQETLRRMESLLEQQQKELEAQGRELAEQRALIQQLQESRKHEASQPDTQQTGETPIGELAGPGGRDNVPAAPVDDQQGIAQERADTESTTEAVVAATDGQSGQEQALAEFAKRKQDAAQGIEIDQTEVLEDPSNTTYDPDFPGAWHLPGTAAAMKIGGYVNLALINSFDPMLISDRFIVGSIPPEGESISGAKSGTEVTANQTRINFEVREATSQGPLRAFVEADFHEEGDTFRLRHAFGQFRWLLAGKTWSTLMDIDSLPEEVDFEGINGEILARQAQIRVFPNFGKSMSFKLAWEDPRTDVVNGAGTRGLADIVMSVGRLPLGQLGSWNSRVAFILRDLEADQTGDDLDDDPNLDDDPSGNTLGWGVTTSGRKPMAWWGDGDSLLWQVTYGEGVGRYLNDLNTVGGGDAVFDPSGKLQPLPVFAGYVSYSHGWPADFWFLKSWQGILRSNFTVSWVNIDNFDYQDGDNYKSTLRASANLIYLPTTNVRFGMELLWGQRKNKDDSKGTATQLQFSARYNF